MITKQISVTNKVATYLKRGGDVICGNTDYAVLFAFDSEWDAYEKKTARFIWNDKYQDVEFTGYTCPMPAVHHTDAVRVGVYAGDLCTTTPAVIPCQRSILCETNVPQPEQEKHYVSEAQQAAREAEAAAAEAKATIARQSNIFANALKGSASGEAVALKDVSPLEHNLKVKISGVDNPEVVKITTMGANLFNVYAITNANKGGGYRDGDTLYNPRGIFTGGSYFEGFSLHLSEGYYHISADVYTSTPETRTATASFYNPEKDKYLTYTYPSAVINTWVRLTWRVLVDEAGEYFISVMGGGNASNSSNLDVRFKNIMVTKEETKDYYPPFEPYVEPVEYAYGEEIKSIHPSTTIMTDTEGAVVEVEYNRDLNRAFAELYQAIISLGGNV